MSAATSLLRAPEYVDHLEESLEDIWNYVVCVCLLHGRSNVRTLETAHPPWCDCGPGSYYCVEEYKRVLVNHRCSPLTVCNSTAKTPPPSEQALVMVTLALACFYQSRLWPEDTAHWGL